jgi:outer membrane receptor protein involved in Fe transport
MRNHGSGREHEGAFVGHRVRTLAAAAVLATFLAPGVTQAQDQVDTYRADFFASARPATAMDMINRLPGFNFDGGDGTRGFSGNSGNVLIDGKRPTSKNDYLGNILGRIVATDVDHIDVIHGSAPGIDMQGKAVMANVVLKNTASTTVVATAGAFLFQTGRVIPQGSLQYSHSEGDTSFDLSIRRDASFNDQMGEANITRIDASGNAVRTEEKVSASGGTTGVNTQVKSPFAGGDFSANLAATQNEFGNSTFYDDPVSPQTYASRQRNQNAEFGASYQHGLGATTLGLELLQRRGHNVSTSLLGDGSSDERFASLRDTGESIGHFTARYPLTGKVTLEAGGEAAYNFLRGQSLYTLNGVTVTVPSSAVDVSEMREEVFGQASWQIEPDLLLDAGVRAEFSTISEHGDVSQERSFFYPKPRAQLTWTLSPKSVLRLRMEHHLGQLNFGDFISSVNLTQSNVTAGNPDLKPDEAWQYELAYEFHFWDKGAITITALHQEISNILDTKPLADASGALFDTRGNIGSGRSEDLSVNALIPTDFLGILEGGRLNLDLDWRDSAVKDPLTGVTRRFQFEDASSYSIKFTQDLEEWKSTWSISYYNGWKEIGYRLAEIDQFLGNPQIFFNWTYKPDPDLNLNFQVANVLISSKTRLSDYFSGPRNISPLLQREIEINYSRPNFMFSVRKTLR